MLVPQSWLNRSTEAWVETDIDLALAKDDHRAVALQIGVQCKGGHDIAFRRKLRYDKHALLDTSRTQQFLDQLAAMQPVPCEVDVHSHLHMISTRVAQPLAQNFPKTKAAPKKHWLSDASWQIIRARGTFKDALRGAGMKNQDDPAQGHNGRLACLCPGRHTHTHTCLSAGLRGLDDGRHKLDTQAAFAMWMRDGSLKSLTATAKEDKKQHILELTSRAAVAASENDSATLFNIVRSLKPSVRRPAKAVILKTGQLAQDPLEACLRWQEHFAEMLRATRSTFEHTVCAHANRAQSADDRVWVRQENLPTPASVTAALAKLKVGRAHGEDCITAEAYGTSPCLFSQILHPLMFKAMLTCSEPLQLKVACRHTSPSRSLAMT